MKRHFILSLFTLLICFSFTNTFKTEQLRYSRVRQAYTDKEASMKVLLDDNGIQLGNLQVYLRAFKNEKLIELWGKNKADDTFILLKSYAVCATSGQIGPKREQGDLQIPEGFYHINVFNPYSNFYLSLGVNYPNKSDRILGNKRSLGGDIYLHGSCVTIGCLPITDDQIKELYILCVEAKNNGQTKIPITFFPAKLTEDNFTFLSNKYEGDTDKIGLWTDLKKGFDIFNRTKKLPHVGFLNDGRHTVTE